MRGVPLFTVWKLSVQISQAISIENFTIFFPDLHLPNGMTTSPHPDHSAGQKPIQLVQVVFSLTRRSRSDVGHLLTDLLTDWLTDWWLALTWLMWPWWVKMAMCNTLIAISISITDSWLALTWLMWPWWVMIPKEDLIYVTLVSDDT